MNIYTESQVVEALVCCGYPRARAEEVRRQDLEYCVAEDEVDLGISPQDKICQEPTVVPGTEE